MLFSLCKHIIAIKSRKISVFFSPSPSGRRHPQRFHSAPSCEWRSRCKRLQGLCWISSAAAGFFSSVSVSVCPDDGWMRAACEHVPQKALCQSVTHKRRRRYKSCQNRGCCKRGWLLITWRGVFLSLFFWFA